MGLIILHVLLWWERWFAYSAFRGDFLGKILEVGLLGGCQLHWGKNPINTVHSPRLQALLTYLILHRDAPASRQHLAFIFFPDSSEAQARTDLRNLFHLLRHALPDPARFLASDAQSLQWRQDAPFTLDVARFRRALSSATTIKDWQRAVEIYRGDLLPGCYDDWILPERERLHQDFVEALEQLMARHEQLRDYLTARHYAQQILSSDPLREDTYRDLMRLSAMSGDRAGVLKFYNQCVNVLHRELEVEPGAETHEAYRQFSQYFEEPHSENLFAGIETRLDNFPA